jgi:hypothetical protein
MNCSNLEHIPECVKHVGIIEATAMGSDNFRMNTGYGRYGAA